MKRSKKQANGYCGWHTGLPDPHYAGRIWFRTDKGTVTLWPVMYLGTMLYLMVYPLHRDVRVYERADLTVKRFGPNPRWARCEPPEEV